MAINRPEVTSRAAETGPEPLLVRPRTAWRMLGCGNTHGYALLKADELESFLDGRSRKITVESIHRLIARRLALTRGLSNVPRRRRWRPPKAANITPRT
jgi:hypothetical protein